MSKPLYTGQTTPGNLPNLSPKTIAAILDLESRLQPHYERAHQFNALVQTALELALQYPFDRERISGEEANRIGWMLGLIIELSGQLADETAELSKSWLVLTNAKSRGEFQTEPSEADGGQP